jgi:hypothetical protein
MIGFTTRNGNKARKQASIERSDEKLVDKIQYYPNEPVALVALRVKGAKITPGEKFNAKAIAETGEGQGNWLDSLEIGIRNKSQKQIRMIFLYIMFPETKGVNGPEMAYDLRIGIPPEKARDTLKRFGKPLALEPGDAFIASLSAEDLNRIKGFLAMRQFQLDSINKVAIKVQFVIFDDGTKWEDGKYYRASPSSPTHWELIEQ